MVIRHPHVKIVLMEMVPLGAMEIVTGIFHYKSAKLKVVCKNIYFFTPVLNVVLCY